MRRIVVLERMNWTGFVFPFANQAARYGLGTGDVPPALELVGLRDCHNSAALGGAAVRLFEMTRIWAFSPKMENIIGCLKNHFCLLENVRHGAMKNKNCKCENLYVLNI